MLSGVIAKKYGFNGLNEDSIVVDLKGTAGQSFGTFLSKGVTLILDGEANDYVGKGLSGGRIVVKPFSKSKIPSNENIIVGNTVLYGAISGECYFSGVAGERFAVRNSGAIAVVEGTGDHCCEYMTGGIIMVLGNTGVNFGAGMSGGIAYVYDNDKSFAKRCNTSMVEIIELNSENQSSSENLFNKQTYLENDEKRIREMLMRHINYTNSQVAKKIIENFSGEIQNFVKVLPLDFKAALKKSKIEVKKEKDRLWQK
jgi:glutamate synthase (NADPH/NADH) large chain